MTDHIKEMLELDEKRAAYWRQRANDLFEQMKAETKVQLGEPFEKAVLSNRSRFERFGARYIFSDFADKESLIRSLSEYDKSTVRIKKAKVQLSPEPLIIGEVPPQ